MRTATCPRCKTDVDYLPEQEGEMGYCLNCASQFRFRQPMHRFVTGAILLVGGFVGLVIMTFFGLLGGLTALASHGLFLIVIVVLALGAGMRARTAMLIFASYYAAIVLMNMLFREPKKYRRAATHSNSTFAVGSHRMPGRCFNTL